MSHPSAVLIRLIMIRNRSTRKTGMMPRTQVPFVEGDLDPVSHAGLEIEINPGLLALQTLRTGEGGGEERGGD